MNSLQAVKWAGGPLSAVLKSTHQKRASADMDRGPKNILIYLAFQDMRVYNMTTANKGRAQGVSSPPRPYAGEATSHTTV